MSIYESKNYKKLLIIPVISVIICLFLISNIRMGLDFSGGTLITAPTPTEIDSESLKLSLLDSYGLEDLDVRMTTGILTEINVQFVGESSLVEAQILLEAEDYQGTIDILKNTWLKDEPLNVSGNTEVQANEYFGRAREKFKNSIVAFIVLETGANSNEISVDEIGPSFGAFFWEQSKNAMIVAFFFITLLVFYFFRAPIVSFAVIQAAFFDVLFGLAAISLFDIRLSLPTIAALLMLIGYSIDTDIMLTDRIMRRKEGTPGSRVRGAMKTGLTMTGTTLGALTGLFIVSSMANIYVLMSISLVLIIGLLGDLISTWFANAPLVLWHMERRQKKFR